MMTRIRGKDPQVSFTEEQLRGLLRRYDTDGDGRLNKKELRGAFDKLGSTCPTWRAWRALRHADANSDGCVNEHEFGKLVEYVTKLGYALA